MTKWLTAAVCEDHGCLQRSGTAPPGFDGQDLDPAVGSLDEAALEPFRRGRGRSASRPPPGNIGIAEVEAKHCELAEVTRKSEIGDTALIRCVSSTSCVSRRSSRNRRIYIYMLLLAKLAGG